MNPVVRRRAGITVALGIALSIAGSSAEVTLRIEGVSGRDGVARPAMTLDLAALAAMPRSTARVRGHDGMERNYEGVPIADILKRAGLPQGEQLRGSLLGR